MVKPKVKSKPKPAIKKIDEKYIRHLKKKIDSLKKHSLSKNKYSKKKTKSRNIVVNLKSDKKQKNDKKIKEMLDKMSTEDLRQLLIKKNIIKDKSKTPDKLLKDIYMYSELCNINISK